MTFGSASGVLLPQCARCTPVLALLALAEFSVDWGKLHNEYEVLWADLKNGSMESAAARQRLRELKSRAERINRRSTPYGTNDKLLLACHQEAAKAIETWTE